VAAGGGGMIVASVLSTFEDAIQFIFEARESRAGTVDIGGLGEIGHLAGQHFLVSIVALLIAIAVSMPIALWLGHKGKGEFLAVSVANVGRAVPSLAIIAFFIAFLGTGFTNVCFALILLAIPPILTNTYVGVRQVDRDLVDAARGQGFSETQIVRRIELPLALPTIFGGIRLSAVMVLATAIIAPLAGYDTLGTPIISVNVYDTAGQIGASIVVAFLTLAADAGFAAVQRLVTPKGLKVATRGRGRRRLWPMSRKRVHVP
jgi:osmoprotectant transport system permease protein